MTDKQYGYNCMKILAVIPARGGSKGIPRKNIRLLHGKPLISYAIENALICGDITDVVVSSDNDEILSIAGKYPISTITRSAELSGDAVTLDPVIHDAVLQMEERKKLRYDVVVTMQPTSPLLKSETLKTAITQFIADDKDSYISVVNRAHLTWSKSESGYTPNYAERLNRQKLPPLYFETGAFFISRRDCVTPTGRLGTNVSVFEIPEDEAVDIDSPVDWQICDAVLNKKRIVFRCDGHKELGMGHIYHCLTLAYHFIGHEIMFVTREQHREGLEKLRSSFMPVTTIQNDEDFYHFLSEWNADVVVNDCLDTTVDYIQKLKSLTKRVVTIEDLGPGSKYADAVINALYSKNDADKQYFFGEKYHCLRDEFVTAEPKEFSQKVHEVLVLFGGTDPSNLTKMVYSSLPRLHAQFSETHFTIITGAGYSAEENGILSSDELNVTVVSDVKRITDYMEKADLAITSQGRTVFELACLGVPSVVMAQNEREQLHTFAEMKNGFVNLGLGINISSDTIERTVSWLIETPQVRKEMRSLMLQHDLKKGVKRIADIILNED